MYIAEIQKIIPKIYPAVYIADKLYPAELYGCRTNQLAKRLAKTFGITHRSSVIDFTSYPQIRLEKDTDHPKNWGVSLIERLTTIVKKDEIGYVSVGYNLSSHQDILPNLASQIVMEAGLTHLDMNDEIPYYGCAASLYSLEKALVYCQKYERPAIIFTFDQCTTGSLQLNEKDDDFEKMLITNLLFTDGGVGMLIIPDALRHRYERPLIKITDIETKYIAGDLIKMHNGKFLMNLNLKHVMPQIVSTQLVKPFLEKRHLTPSKIQEWSIHQGGSQVLEQFCRDDVLNLTHEQINQSLQKFYEYGNMSSVSCLLVLESFFNTSPFRASPHEQGIILGFGAGYYLGIALYIWDV